MMGLLTAINSGIDLVLHASGILGSTLAFSYEKFVLDDELCGAVRRYQRGLNIAPETLAADVIVRVGSSGDYLTDTHTLEHFRDEAWLPQVSDRAGLVAWMAAGRPDALTRARQRWKRLLAGHEDPPMDTTVAKQLGDYVDKYST
jgi:trimethylamine--corrinoid protein Co-methyltransferase